MPTYLLCVNAVGVQNGLGLFGDLTELLHGCCTHIPSCTQIFPALPGERAGIQMQIAAGEGDQMAIPAGELGAASGASAQLGLR